MPNVLLIGGSAALYQMLRDDSRWNVVRAMHPGDKASGSALGDLGDPRNWHLVIDDCHHAEIAAAEADALVTDAYLSEAARARGIIFCKGQHDEWRLTPPSGQHDFEANPTDAPEAIHLVDFFDEFEDAFVNRYLTTHVGRLSIRAVPLMVNSYGGSLAVLQAEIILPARLTLIDLADDKSRLKAFEHLLYRTVPKLWPEVYSDQFRPRRVIELEGLREQEIADRRLRVAEIDTAIDAELAFYAAYTPLTLLADDPLKELVGRAFAEVFECEVIDLDKETEEGKPKTLDLEARRAGWSAFLEVRSSGTRGARIKVDIEPLDEHVEKIAEKYGPPDSKVLVFNGLYRKEPEQRTEEALFSQQVADEARERGITLLSTKRLLEVIEARRNGDMTTAHFIEALTRAGVFEPP
jgi:hypothetical protein